MHCNPWFLPIELPISFGAAAPTAGHFRDRPQWTRRVGAALVVRS
jgi:hypothetical protein